VVKKSLNHKGTQSNAQSDTKGNPTCIRNKYMETR